MLIRRLLWTRLAFVQPLPAVTRTARQARQCNGSLISEALALARFQESVMLTTLLFLSWLPSTGYRSRHKN